jgi:hypothetical protein
MNNAFETLSTGNEFESASEEFERNRYRSSSPRSTSRQGGKRNSSPSYSRPRSPRYYGPATWPAWGGPGSAYQSCMQQCLAAPDDRSRPYPASAAEPDRGPAPEPDGPSEEMNMHPYRCRCRQCAGPNKSAEFAGEGEYEGEFEFAAEQEGEGGPFTEAEEIALAAELLSVSNEAELEQFLGKLWSTVKKVGGAVAQVAKPFSGVLKAVAKKALPFVGGALGSMIPIPGVGTALGTALGSAVSQALEMELEGLEMEDREFEMARRFVRIAGTAAQQLEPQAEGGQAVHAAVTAAAQQHLPHLSSAAPAPGARGSSGRWIRHGTTLVLTGV